MEYHEFYQDFLIALDQSPLFKWGGPGQVWACIPFGDGHGIMTPLFQVEDPSHLHHYAEWMKTQKRATIPANALAFIVDSLRGTDEEQYVVRELCAMDKDAEFLVLHMNHNTKEVTEYDFMQTETPAMAGMREIGSVVWPLS